MSTQRSQVSQCIFPSRIQAIQNLTGAASVNVHPSTAPRLYKHQAHHPMNSVATRFSNAAFGWKVPYSAAPNRPPYTANRFPPTIPHTPGSPLTVLVSRATTVTQSCRQSPSIIPNAAQRHEVTPSLAHGKGVASSPPPVLVIP